MAQILSFPQPEPEYLLGALGMIAGGIEMIRQELQCNPQNVIPFFLMLNEQRDSLNTLIGAMCAGKAEIWA